ncbi:MAG TPA: flagellar export protein FliJ [Candidatus Butyricicoccus avistercoris]|uniref:Flagellar FliJ protein n=1 Tax=Candidatus Butyricicoccus avistercoris TaxID=2838518 RepID=A0A9D1TI16_9FIRM|nr:flagellar export protein FliJ [Candidatus Butyricicoccus avistercoris]
MKKFRFSLETVLHYREQMLDAVKAEHASALLKVRTQEDVIENLVNQFNDINNEYRHKKMTGMTIADAMSFDIMLRAQERKIDYEKNILVKLKHDEEEKREKVRQAKTDKATIEKIKETKYNQYKKAIQKSEEQFIDEFVSTKRVMAAN